MKNKVDIVYVVASKLGSIGMGSTSQEALRGIEKTGLKYKAFSRGYSNNIPLNKKNLTNYSFLEYLSYPFRFLEKYFGLKINSFKMVNSIFRYFIWKNLPKTRAYHTWIDVAPKAIKKTKRDGAILILEGANSHPINMIRIMNSEYEKQNMKEYLIDEKEIEKNSRIYKEFDYIMCPSDFVYESFLNQGFSKKKLIKMPYGVNIEKFKPSEKKKKDKIKFVFVGSIQLRKGIQYLLQAWEELDLKNAELTIVGRVWPDAQKIISKCKNLKNVKFLGFVKPYEILRNSDVFISPSLEEGSALTCYEAMACGLPLIATTNTGSVLRDKKDGFIIPIRDVNAIKEKILYFYDNPKQIEKMGKAARKRVEKFSWKNYGERLGKFYKNLL